MAPAWIGLMQVIYPFSQGFVIGLTHPAGRYGRSRLDEVKRGEY